MTDRDQKQTILHIFAEQVVENDTTDTGYAYKTGSDDETVARAAETELGCPVSKDEIKDMRQFLGTICSTGEFTVDDVRRFRIFFFGRLAEEVETSQSR